MKPSTANLADKYILKDGSAPVPVDKEIQAKLYALTQLEADPDTIRLVREAIHVMRGGGSEAMNKMRERERDNALAVLDRALAALLVRHDPEAL